MEGQPPEPARAPAGVPPPAAGTSTGPSEPSPTCGYVGGPGPWRGLAVVAGLVLLIWVLASRVQTGADPMVQQLGRLEVTARLLERPDQFPKLGAYRYTYVLKYKVLSVHRQDPEGKYPLKAGDDILVRGPYGRPFPINGHKDVLFICGGIGIVPLRPLIHQIAAMRAGSGGTVAVVYGSREPSEVLFMDEVSAWMDQGINIVMTVDRCDIESWKGCTGLVTEHFGKARVDFKNCTAYLCGPHVMIQAAMRDLSLMGVPDDRIITTLEAHMKCGVGKCGHCYCGGKLICEEGPIFSLEEMKNYNIKPGVDSLA